MGLKQTGNVSNTLQIASYMSERISNNSTESFADQKAFQIHQVGPQNHQEEYQKPLEEFQTCRKKITGRVSNTRKCLKHDGKCCRERERKHLKYVANPLDPVWKDHKAVKKSFC